MARIVVIDDDRNVLAAVRRCLRRSGYEPLTYDNPRHALRSFGDAWPDLILLDVSMPTLSGHETLRRIRRMESGRMRRGLSRSVLPTPVLFLTALAATHQVIAGFDAGVTDYVIKPFDADELRARVRNQLRFARDSNERITNIGLNNHPALTSMASAIRSCNGPLLELDLNLLLANAVKR
ncbi:MAG: response regulator transcription factor, partial [Phycisphaerales bacterium]|nr:response regulator transcription factor [Phycisphaerales bacterium]